MSNKRSRVVNDDAYWEEQRRLVAEDGGHMGWTRDHFPGCNDMSVTKTVEDNGKKVTITQLSLFR